MLSINVRTNSCRRTVSADITSTPRRVFDELGIDTTGSFVNLNGAQFSASDFNKTFEELGVEDGGTANLNAIVKADGAQF